MGICASNDSGHEYNTLGYQGGTSSGDRKREPTPPPPIKYPTPPPPKDPTPPPKDPTPPPPKSPSPPPKPPPTREPTPPPNPPPPREPTPPPEEPKNSTPPPTESSPPPILYDPAPGQQKPEQFQNESEAHVESIPEPKSSGVLEYRRNETLGTHIFDLDFRTDGEEYDTEPMPDTFEDGLYVDKEFTLHEALGSNATDLFWKRPKDIAPEPCLFSEGTTRYDVGQGSIGTCWFLSMVSVIADKPHLIEQVIPEGSYPTDPAEYNGSFRCRLWRYGRFEDTYIDDFLPCDGPHRDGRYRIIGAHSATDPNEMWVSLLEKAFARSYGSYEAVTGGLCADSFLLLTSGVPEYIKFKEMEMNKKQLFRRIKNALRSGAMVACSVPVENHEHCGLIGGHAYSLTGIKELDKGPDLVRVRNPWGHHEWTGDWSDKSALWDDYGGMEEHDDGEFYMSFDDFTTYFDDVTICCLLPDFDRDGKADSSLNCIANIYGNWRDETAAGFKEKKFNPKYLIEVPESAYADADGRVALVLHMIQRTKQRKRDFVNIRCDIFKVLHETDDGILALEELGVNTNTYSKLQQTTHRHLVTPGKYLIIPSTIEAEKEKEFLVRVFTADPLKALEDLTHDDKYTLLFGDNPNDRNPVQTPFSRWITGAWTDNNCGGQAAHSTVDINPQYKVTVYEKGFVSFTLMQTLSKAYFDIGFKMWKVEDESDFPMNVNFLYAHYDDDTVVKTTDDKDGEFIGGPYAKCSYMLDPGEYLILTFLDKPSDRTTFALCVRSEHQVQIEAQNLR